MRVTPRTLPRPNILPILSIHVGFGSPLPRWERAGVRVTPRTLPRPNILPILSIHVGFGSPSPSMGEGKSLSRT